MRQGRDYYYWSRQVAPQRTVEEGVLREARGVLLVAAALGSQAVGAGSAGGPATGGTGAGRWPGAARGDRIGGERALPAEAVAGRCERRSCARCWQRWRAVGDPSGVGYGADLRAVAPPPACRAPPSAPG